MTDYNPLWPRCLEEQKWFDNQLAKLIRERPKIKTTPAELGEWYYRKTFFPETDIINKYLTGENNDN